MKCPLCGADLPEHAPSCTRCDWIRPELAAPPEAYQGINGMAAALSIVPGLGHLYKGHMLTGMIIFAIGNLVIIPLAVVLLPGTLGLSILIIPLFVLVVMVHGFQIEDLRAEERHPRPGQVHPLHPPTPLGKRR